MSDCKNRTASFPPTVTTFLDFNRQDKPIWRPGKSSGIFFLFHFPSFFHTNLQILIGASSTADANNFQIRRMIGPAYISPASKGGSRPDMGSPTARYHGFDHIVFWVGNAKQAASFYCTRFGFKRILYRGLETNHRQVVSHVCQKNGIFFVFQSPLNPPTGTDVMSEHIKRHGDGVRDVAFRVSDCRAMFQKAIERGAKPIKEPWEESDEHGTVVFATIATVST